MSSRSLTHTDKNKAQNGIEGQLWVCLHETVKQTKLHNV